VAEADPASSPGSAPANLPRTRNELVLRVCSAAVLAPLVLTLTYIGGWPYDVLWAAAAFGILWEWSNLVFKRPRLELLLPGGAAYMAALVLAGTGRLGMVMVVIGIGAAVAAAIVSAGERLWAAGGTIYAGAAFAGPILVRHDSDLGFAAIIFLFAVVWTTDILAYFAGRAIGGPKLWPRVSPRKTWSGAIAGTLGGVAAGGATACLAGGVGLFPILAVAFTLSVLSQAGDLFESALKRRFALKDTSGLIPGHGGLMDRLDGFLVVALAAAVIGISRQGLDAPARGLLIW
jgi:phosphatidate cytidylyltransferase